MDEIVPIIVVPTVLFMIFVAPIWIVMHYRSKGRAQASLSDGERSDIERLCAAADNMRERIETLESILDSDAPDWRRRDAAAE